ncbi:unnamed protein product [Heterobilharzia americana]|nr:unnamed protein product [Heterobilharzia americana]CAH8611245.1 unnamed protein product [Heterobilharzia americana]
MLFTYFCLVILSFMIGLHGGDYPSTLKMNRMNSNFHLHTNPLIVLSLLKSKKITSPQLYHTYMLSNIMEKSEKHYRIPGFYKFNYHHHYHQQNPYYNHNKKYHHKVYLPISQLRTDEHFVNTLFEPIIRRRMEFNVNDTNVSMDKLFDSGNHLASRGWRPQRYG